MDRLIATENSDFYCEERDLILYFGYRRMSCQRKIGHPQNTTLCVILSVVELLDEGTKRIHPKAKIVKTIFGIYLDLYLTFLK